MSDQDDTTTEQPQPGNTEQPQPGNRVAVREYRDADLDGRFRYANALAQAGNLLPPSMRDPASGQFSPGRVMLIAETGSMLGLHPVAALTGINVIEGKPAASAALMSAVIRGNGHKLRISESGTIEGGDYQVTATLIRHDDPDAPFTSTWTPHRAARAGLCTYVQTDGIWRVSARSSRGSALPWESYTESLCKARAVSEVARDGAQDVLLGVRYTPEELGVAVDRNGEVIEGEIVDEPAPASALPKASKRPAAGRQGTRKAPAAPAPTPDPEPAADADVAPAADIPAAEPEVVVDQVTGEVADIQDDEARKRRIANRRAADDAVADEPPAPTDDDAPDDEDVVDAEVVDDEPPMVMDDADDDGSAPTFDSFPVDAYMDRLAAAATVADVRQVWDDATAADALDTDLRQAILARKAEVEAA